MKFKINNINEYKSEGFDFNIRLKPEEIDLLQKFKDSYFGYEVKCIKTINSSIKFKVYSLILKFYTFYNILCRVNIKDNILISHELSSQSFNYFEPNIANLLRKLNISNVFFKKFLIYLNVDLKINNQPIKIFEYKTNITSLNIKTIRLFKYLNREFKYKDKLYYLFNTLVDFCIDNSNTLTAKQFEESLDDIWLSNEKDEKTIQMKNESIYKLNENVLKYRGEKWFEINISPKELDIFKDYLYK